MDFATTALAPIGDEQGEATFRSLLGRVRGEVKDLDADDIDSGNFGVE